MVQVGTMGLTITFLTPVEVCKSLLDLLQNLLTALYAMLTCLILSMYLHQNVDYVILTNILESSDILMMVLVHVRTSRDRRFCYEVLTCFQAVIHCWPECHSQQWQS
ncbi:hypothetical protein AcW1_008925 [Taiwanofungus camphoratus]|nr:hypothetical protein AcW1_008925 [Antrodia cinnamomea]